LYKLANFVFHISPGSPHWPCSAHERLFVGILLLLLKQRTLLLMGLETQLRQVQVTGDSNGGDILRILLQTPRRLASVSEGVARKVLWLPGGENSQKSEWKKKRETRGTSRDKGRSGSIMGFEGAHASILFQCERCWLLNLKGHLPADGLDDIYVTYVYIKQ
jgi:hypothetical protein